MYSYQPYYPIGSTTQAVSYTGTSARSSTAFAGNDFVGLFCSTTDCHIKMGSATPTATTSDLFLPAKFPIILAIRPGEKVAAIKDSADGILYVTEMSR